MVREPRTIWRKRVAELHRSGKSIREFAKEIGVNPKTLAGWKIRLANERRPTASRRTRQRPVIQSAEIDFVDITGALSQDSDEATGSVERFELLLGNGLTVRIPAQFEESGLRRLLDVVEGR